jgi:hypothetical protein
LSGILSNGCGHNWTAKKSLTGINFCKNQIRAFFSERMSWRHFQTKADFVSKGLGKLVSNGSKKTTERDTRWIFNKEKKESLIYQGFTTAKE